MKTYKCVFIYERGRTTIDVTAEDAANAMVEASSTVSQREAEKFEVWDETGLVLSHDFPGMKKLSGQP